MCKRFGHDFTRSPKLIPPNLLEGSFKAPDDFFVTFKIITSNGLDLRPARSVLLEMKILLNKMLKTDRFD